MVACSEAGHDAIIGFEAIAVVIELKRFHQDGVSVSVIGKYHVVITVTGED